MKVVKTVTMKVVRAFAPVLVAGLILTGCALFTGGRTAEAPPPPPTTEETKRSPRTKGLPTSEVEKHGAVILLRPFAQVFEATADTLNAMGYGVAVSKPKRGLLISGRLRVGRETSTLGIILPSGMTGSTTQSVSYSRQYTVHLKKLGPRRTWLAAVPSVFAGAHDISGSVRWTLYGHFGERSRWKQFFKKIRDLLPDQASPRKPSPPRQRFVPPPRD